MKIAFVADIHYCGNEPDSTWFSKSRHEEFSKKIHEHKPDVLIFGGDIAESYANPNLLGECLDIYKNPHGASLFIPGNHDVWCLGMIWGPGKPMDCEEKYLWNLSIAEQHGWVPLWNKPWSFDNVSFVGNMGWYNLKSSRSMGLEPEFYETRRNWSDYKKMDLESSKLKSPMLAFCRRRMKELDESFLSLPNERRALVVVTHMVGFDRLLGFTDDKTAYFGNDSIGKRVLKSNATHYLCGHTHFRMETVIAGVHCLNNGSDYGSKRCDIVKI
jgi:predicted phosphodiesterase